MAEDFDTLVRDGAERAETMQGWDFSYVKGRRHSDRHPWSYSDVVCAIIDDVRDMLDMDTGGGEVLLDLKEHAPRWPTHVCATERYGPNVVVATRTLRPIDVEVVECRSNDTLPFKDDSFDLITNRHGDYSVPELKRVLRPSGVFVTQQIGFGTKRSVNALLNGPEPAYERIDFGEMVSRFEAAGFEIVEQREFHGRDVFDDIGALVFVLTAAPWEIPDFSVEGYRDRLHRLHRTIQSEGPLDIGGASFLIVARNR